MAVSSINIMRVSQNMRSISLLETLRQNTLKLYQEQNRLSTGYKYNTPSEDPVGAGRAMQLTEVLERQEQILKNLSHADAFLSTTDSAIGEVNDLLIQAHDIASEMVNSTADSAQRESMAQLVKSIIDQLVAVGNRMYGNVYLFGGQQTTSPPFTQDYGGVVYRGDTNALTAHIAQMENANINLNGADLFGALQGRYSGYVDLDPALTADTRLADLAGIDNVGVNKGRILISLDTPAKTFQVDLSHADTVGDVLDMINAAAKAAGLNVGPGGDFNASINAAGSGLQIDVRAGTVSVTEAGESTTARDLGILGSGAAIVGRDLHPRLVNTTTVAVLFGGAGAGLGKIRIQNGTLQKDIDLAGATSIQDILNRINTAGVEVRAEINSDATGIDVINLLSGSSMSVGEVGGVTAALLGIRTFHGQSRLSELNGGRGVSIKLGQADFRIVAKNGMQFDVSLDGAQTVQDVLDKINAAATAAGVAVTASLASSGNGIRIVDATGGGGVLQIERQNLSYAIDDLGLNKSVANPGDTELLSDDVNQVKVDSAFSALIDLYEALVGGGEHVEQAITAAGEKLSKFIDQTNQWQGIVGARAQVMHTRLEFTEDAVTTTRSLLSESRDLDYTEAVTRFQMAQMALQANLMTGQRMLSMSLLDYLV